MNAIALLITITLIAAIAALEYGCDLWVGA